MQLSNEQLAMTIHTGCDLLAWFAAYAVGRFVQRRYLTSHPAAFDFSSHPHYFTALAIAAAVGALFFGTLNLALGSHAASETFRLGHSSAGAIAGGIVGAEWYKWRHRIRQSTGLLFVAPLAAGLMVGRIGCFLTGLPDRTFGTPTDLPWGYDFGDGVLRHPVQLYESLAMALFLVAFLIALRRANAAVLAAGFYLFILFYAGQRFCWEFLKPYPTLLLDLNLFHLLLLALIGYALAMLRAGRSQ